MKTLHLIDHDGIGGAQTLVSALIAKKHGAPDCHFLVLRKAEYAHMKLAHDNVHRCEAQSKYYSVSIFKIRKLLKDLKIDLLHCHLEKSFVAGLLVKKLFFPSIKLVLHEHGSVFLRPFLYKYFFRTFRQAIDHTISVSQAAKVEFQKKVGVQSDKVSVVRNFIDPVGFSSQSSPGSYSSLSPTTLKRHNFVIGFLGRLSQEKRVNVLLEAVSKLDSTVNLVIGGAGPERHRLERLARTLNLPNRVRFLGYVSDHPSFFSACDIFVLPSRQESFPLSALEAQSYGVPTIVSRLPALAEVFTEDTNVLMFTPDDVEELCLRINQLFHDTSLRERIARTGKEDVKRFTFERFSHAIDDIYSSV